MHIAAFVQQKEHGYRTAIADMAPSDLLIFHHPSSRSVRIVWLCEEIGLKYDLDVITVYIATTASDSKSAWVIQHVQHRNAVHKPCRI